MNVSARDKQVLIIGAVAAAGIVILGYVVIPAIRGWNDSRASLSSQQSHVAELRERIDSQGALVKQRNALVARLGSLFEAPPEAPKRTEEKPAKPEESKETWFAEKGPQPDKEEKEPPKPETQEQAKEDAEPAEKKEEMQREEGPPAGATLAGYVEQQAKKAEVTVKSITPGKTSSGLRGVKQYRPVMLQVKVACKAKGLVALLAALEKGERFVKVEQVQVHRDIAKDELNVTLDVRSYEAEARPS